VGDANSGLQMHPLIGNDRVSISPFFGPLCCRGCTGGAVRARSADAITGPAGRLAQAARARQTPCFDLRIQDAQRTVHTCPAGVRTCEPG